MCEQVGRLAALDSRYRGHKINEYLAPTVRDHGRFPDILVDWGSFGKFAIEFQMSNTFETEISARCKHYEQEGIPLLWILDVAFPIQSLEQNFKDVIRRHRRNMFLLNKSAIKASREQQTLILACALQNEDGFEEPKLVRFDELKIPRSKLPYYEDRIVVPRLQKNELKRGEWLAQLTAGASNDSLPGIDSPRSRLIAAAFSIFQEAKGNNVKYLYSKDMNVKGMLNALLNREDAKPHATLIENLLQNSRLSGWLAGSVGEHIRRAKITPQKGPDSDEWRLLKACFPEILDTKERDRLKSLDALPAWAQNASA
jgi:hypothetical protein